MAHTTSTLKTCNVAARGDPPGKRRPRVAARASVSPEIVKYMNKTWISVMTAMSLLCASPAFAQNNEDFGKSAVARIMESKAKAPQKGDTRTLAAPKPATPFAYHEETPEDVDGLMARVEAQNGELVKEFEQLVEKDPLNPDAPKWLSQIAEFHWQMAHYAYLRERRAWMAKLDGCDDAETPCPPEPVADYSASIADYRRILSQYPTYAHMDEVLFRLGDGLIRNQQPKEGIGYLHRLTQSYPDYKDLDAAYLAIGEFYFSQKNTGTAQAAYQTILDKYPRSQYYQYAQYKLAWTYLNLGEEEDYRKSIGLFRNVVESIDTQYASAIDSNGQIDENKLKAGTVSFRNQALNDLSTTYAELPGGWKEARSYLQTKLPPDKARDKTEQLGQILDAQGKLEEEIELYTDLMRENPNHPHLLQWYTATIEAHKQANHLDEAESTTREAIRALLPDSPWYKANSETTAAAGARRFCAEQIYMLAIQDMSKVDQAPAAERDKLLADAEDLLRLELKHFDEGASSFDIHYSFAYVLDERSDASLAQIKKQYGKKLASDPSLASGILPKLEEAAQAYQTVIDWPEQADDERKEQIRVAANRQVFVYANILATSDPEWSIINSAKAQNFVEEKRDSEIREKTPLSAAEKGFVKSAEQYASRYPKDDETPAFLWRAAEIYRAHNDYDQAAQRFDSIVTDFPEHQYAAVSVGSMFELYNKARNYEKIEYWAKWLIERKNFKHYTTAELENTASFAVDKQAVALADADQIDDAVHTMMRIEQAFPKRTDLTTAARFKAAAFEEKRKGYAASIELLEPVTAIADTPQNLSLALYKTAVAQYRLAKYPQAAENFEKSFSHHAALFEQKPPAESAKPNSKASKKASAKNDKNAAKQHAASSVSQEDTNTESRIHLAQSVLYGAQLLRKLGHHDRCAQMLDKYIALNGTREFEIYQDGEKIETKPGDNRVPLLTQSAAISERASLAADKSPAEAASVLAAYFGSDLFKAEPETLQRQMRLQQAQYLIDARKQSDALAILNKLNADEDSWSRTELARHAYLNGRCAQLDFEDVVLEFPIRTLRKRIDEKAKKRQNAEKYYQKAIGYKNATISTAAAYELAQMALNFRDAFRNLPPPKELENDPAALDDYNVWVEDELIFPAEDAAASLLDVAQQITLQLQSYTTHARKSAQTLAELKPDMYPVKESSGDP